MRCRGRRLLLTPGTWWPLGTDLAACPAGCHPPALCPSPRSGAGPPRGPGPGTGRRDGAGVPLGPLVPTMSPCPRSHPAPLRLLPRCRFAGTQDGAVLEGPQTPNLPAQWGHPNTGDIPAVPSCGLAMVQRGQAAVPHGVPPATSSPGAGVQSPGTLRAMGHPTHTGTPRGCPCPHRSGAAPALRTWGSPPFSTARGRLCCCVSPKLWGGGI